MISGMHRFIPFILIKTVVDAEVDHSHHISDFALKSVEHCFTGLLLEYGLNDKSKIIEYDDATRIDEYTSNQKINKLQAGANLGLGINYHLAPKVDIYLSSGIRHYFYQSHYNMWTDKNLWPSMQMGIRLKH